MKKNAVNAAPLPWHPLDYVDTVPKQVAWITSTTVSATVSGFAAALNGAGIGESIGAGVAAGAVAATLGLGLIVVMRILRHRGFLRR